MATHKPTQCFLFFPHRTFFKSNFSQPAFGTFGFVRHTSQPFTKPKEPNFPYAPDTINNNFTKFANI
jgi:hypothetical protein